MPPTQHSTLLCLATVWHHFLRGNIFSEACGWGLSESLALRSQSVSVRFCSEHFLLCLVLVFYLLYDKKTDSICFFSQTRKGRWEQNKESEKQDGQLDVCISHGGQLGVWQAASLLLLSGYFVAGRCGALACLYCSIAGSFNPESLFLDKQVPRVGVQLWISRWISPRCCSIPVHKLWKFPKYVFCTHMNAAIALLCGVEQQRHSFCYKMRSM